MFPAVLSDRLDEMIDDLIMDGGIESASLASILLAAKDSLNRDSLVTLSSKVWAANNELRSILTAHESAPSPFDETDLSLRESFTSA